LNATATYPLPITRPWIYHSLFWLAYYAFATLISLTIHQIDNPHFYVQLLTMLPPDMLLVYCNLYLLLPHLLLKRKFILYGLLLLICMSIISALNLFLHHLYGLSGSKVYAPTGEFNGRNFASQLMNCIYLIGLVTGLKFLKDWMSQREKLQKIEREQVAMELNFLKSQVHPHFFFNTLNNLYSLTLQKSDLAPEVVLKLSDLMSYMLYDSGAALVSLDKEVVNLDNYIALEKLRFGSRLSLSFEKEGLKRAVTVPPAASCRIKAAKVIPAAAAFFRKSPYCSSVRSTAIRRFCLRLSGLGRRFFRILFIVLDFTKCKIAVKTEKNG